MVNHDVSPSLATALRERLRRGRASGTFVKLPGAAAIDIVAGCGFDFAIVDLEHSQLSVGEALNAVHHAFALRFPALVRIPECSAGLVNRLLEAGAAGIQLSSVRRVAEVEALIAATRYPPHGSRSVSLAQPVAGYGAVPLGDAVAAPHPLLVGQVETAETVDPLAAIAAAGLDVVFLGATDLSVDLRFDAGRIEARAADIAAAARNAGVVFGEYVGRIEAARPEARYVAVSSDLGLLRQAMTEAARPRA